MAFRSRIRRRLGLLLRSEHGMALPTALFATIASLGLGSAAVMASIEVQQGTKRDTGAKQAIAAADAGARVAIMRLNRYQDKLVGTTFCVGTQGETQIPVGGWCPTTSPETIGNSTFSYRFAAVGSGECDGWELCVVATGSAAGVTRRVLVNFDDDGIRDPSDGGENPPDPGEEDPPVPPEPEDERQGVVTEGLVGEDSVTMSGSSDVRVGVGTNGNLTTSGNASICGGIRVGVGKKWVTSGSASQCKGYGQVEGNKTLPPVSSFIPADIATNNSNYRLMKCKSTNNPVGCQSDGFSGSWSDTSPYNPSTRTISASGSRTITLTGGDYWLCSISLSGSSQLIMGKGANVRVFFDTPEKCGGVSPINMSGNNRIAATGYQPTVGQFEMPGFFVLGSSKTATSITLSGNNSTTNEFIIYAPNSNITVTGNATFKGLIAGKTMYVTGNGTIMNDKGFQLPPNLNPWLGNDGDPGNEDPPDPGDEEPPESDPTIYYTAQSFVECTGIPAAGEAPNSSC